MTILDEVRETFRDTPIGTQFTTAEIKHLVFTKFGRTKGSIIPSDYCYYKRNKGKIGPLETFNLFLWIKRGLYVYVGENYSTTE